MIALAMIVGHKLRNRMAKRCLPEEDHPIQTFFLYGTDKSLRERVLPSQQLHRVRSLKHP
jgi:hypothetical protein